MNNEGTRNFPFHLVFDDNKNSCLKYLITNFLFFINQNVHIQ
jgi:hypothetical protein